MGFGDLRGTSSDCLDRFVPHLLALGWVRFVHMRDAPRRALLLNPVRDRCALGLW
jgi:hypothetical protein